MKQILSFLLVGVLALKGACGQDTISHDDYKRAVKYLRNNYHNKTTFNLSIRARWFSDNTGMWYVNRSPKGKRYVKITLPGLKKTDLFDHKKLAKILTDSLSLDWEIKPHDLPVSAIKYQSPHELLITTWDKRFILNTKTYSLSTPKKNFKQNNTRQISPDKKWRIYTKDHNLYIRSAKTNEVRQLSKTGKKGYEYASWYGWNDMMVGESSQRPQRFGAGWSKDSQWISAYICDLRTARKMYLLDWSVDTLYRPRLLSYYRGSPGDTGMVYMDPVFFNVRSGKEIKPRLPRCTHINMVSVEWSKTPGKVFLRRQSRGYKDVHIYTFDLETEQLRTIYTETSKTNIDNFTHKLVEDSNLMFFLSEKSGWRQLYSLNLKTGKEKRVTNGRYFINSIERIDEKNQKIYFLASGKEKGCNPYYQQFYSISFGGQQLQLLTSEHQNHRVNISWDGKYFVDNFSTISTPTTIVLRSMDNGRILCNMGRADVSMMKGWSPPEVFTATARDGKTKLYGAIWKPTNFDSTKRYPVLEESYTGPHTHKFPVNFRHAFRLQSYAELGFVLVVVDGRGSSGRSKKFHDYSYKNLGGSLEDHVQAIKQLGRKFSWVDTTRVGIFGHSAGGYDAAHAVLAYPDFYKVAVASSADHDHRMEKAWWPEMYMGWPVDSAYHLQSNITLAGNLKGKLLLVHGGLDENVNPSASFKLAEALIKADKRFDLLVLPSQRHSYLGNHLKYFTKTRWNYFIRHLRGVEPIWNFEWE